MSWQAFVPFFKRPLLPKQEGAHNTKNLAAGDNFHLIFINFRLCCLVGLECVTPVHAEQKKTPL